MAKEPNLKYYELKMHRLYHTTNIRLFVGTMRGARGKRKLYAEAFLRDPWNPWMHFKVNDAKDEDDLVERFLKQVVHRGYIPLQGRRYVNGSWEDWQPIDVSQFDLTRHRLYGKPFQFVDPESSAKKDS